MELSTVISISPEVIWLSIYNDQKRSPTKENDEYKIQVEDEAINLGYSFVFYGFAHLAKEGANLWQRPSISS